MIERLAQVDEWRNLRKPLFCDTWPVNWIFSDYALNLQTIHHVVFLSDSGYEHSCVLTKSLFPNRGCTSSVITALPFLFWPRFDPSRLLQFAVVSYFKDSLNHCSLRVQESPKHFFQYMSEVWSCIPDPYIITLTVHVEAIVTCNFR